jgi:hypothetical protein
MELSRVDLPDNAVGHVDHTGRQVEILQVQIGGRDFQLIEQPDALAEQKRHQVDVDLIQQTFIQALLDHTGSTYDHILVPCDVLRLLDRLFYSSGDEGEW